MKKVKVLCVLPSLRICNGVASYAMNYYKNISNIDMDFVVANLDTKSDYFDEIKANGNKIYNLSKNASKNFFDYIYKIKKFFKENANKYDIIHCHVANAGAIFLYYAKKYGIKVRIIHSHATETSDNKIKQIRNNLILPLTIHNATNYFACSDKAGKAMFKNKKFCVVNNAINCEKYKFNEAYREEIRKEFNIENDEYLIGNIGRFVHQKNQEYLLNIANELDKKEIKYKVFILGTGPLESKLHEQRRNDNLEENVIFINPRNDVYKFYSAFDLFVLPSLYEGLPVVGIEAQCNGLPCLFSDTITKEVKINDNVKFISLKNLDGWKEYISNKYFKREEIKYFDNNSFNIKVEAQKLKRIYISLCDERDTENE